jgi:hypothetical protein
MKIAGGSKHFDARASSWNVGENEINGPGAPLGV